MIFFLLIVGRKKKKLIFASLKRNHLQVAVFPKGLKGWSFKVVGEEGKGC